MSADEVHENTNLPCESDYMPGDQHCVHCGKQLHQHGQRVDWHNCPKRNPRAFVATRVLDPPSPKNFEPPFEQALVGVDFDNTLVVKDGPYRLHNIGEPRGEAIHFIKELDQASKNGDFHLPVKFVLYTSRRHDEIDLIRDWLYNVGLGEIITDIWTTKPPFFMLIDDRTVNPQHDGWKGKALELFGGSGF